MFVRSFQNNRWIASGGFYFVYLLFFLHICTAFSTIIHAFNEDTYEKEEIVQLSMDSIHTIKSTESPFLKAIEANTDDNEENDLLLALLTSYDDHRLKVTTKSIDNEMLIINTSSSIRFTPSCIHFPEQSIGIPRMQTIVIINDDSEPLEISSLAGTTNEFYSSLLKQTILAPHGGNVTINIYYLPRTIGPTSSIFIIKTDRGDFSYDVSGVGRENPFRLRPLVNIEIPLNSTYEYTISFYNPSNSPLTINEIYTSDENLIIELLSNKNHVKKIFEYHEQWYLKPYETKPIIKINYLAYKLSRLHGFICIKTNFSENIILPVEINVLNRSGLYSNVDLLEFSTERFLRPINKSIKIPVYAFNHGLNPVTITDVRVPSEHEKYLTIRYKNQPIVPDIHRLNQIADVTIHLDLIPNSIERIYGYVQVYTSTDHGRPVLKIPFDEKIIQGSLDFNEQETLIYLSDDRPTEDCQPIKVFNRYKSPISVYNITINKFEVLSRYIQVKQPSSPFYLHPNQWTDLLCITRLPQPLLSISFNSIQAVIDIYTNLSQFNFPLHLYNGYLNLEIVNDQTNGGIQQNENNPLELLITSIPVNTDRTVRFVLTNSNPIDIKIDRYDFTISNADIQLDSMISLDGNQTKIKIKNKKQLSSIIIPKQHQAIFLLTIHGINPPAFYSEEINIQTGYQTLHINVQYEIVNGSLEFGNKTPIHIDVFPNRLATADVFIENRFDEPVNLSRIHFITYGLCFSFTWSNTFFDHRSLQPNKIERIGQINFDIAPLCKSILPPSESTCYCGLNHHPELKHDWEESISLMNTYELDEILVNKFRNLWKEWAALLRKQRIQTNVWLYTNRANISWPVTIAFMWPSVLERTFSSGVSAPMVVDFQVTFINITKMQNVTIINPSSDLLAYSIALLDNVSSSNERIFTISLASKQLTHPFHFYLLPNEQITFTVSYRPTSAVKHEAYLIVRNNLTIIESTLLRGEGGIGGLEVGSSLIPIVLEINANQYPLCSNPNGNPVLQKTLTLRNTGNLQTTIYDISFGDSQCSGQGFSVGTCRNIELEPQEKYDLKILFQPNYTCDEITDTLILNTNIGLMVLPIVVRIPQRVLSACYRTITRPPWEWRSYCLGLCLLAIMITLIYSAAVYNAQKLFYDYLIRAEWRHQIQTTDNKIFNLSDLSSAIQDEQKPRERADSSQTADVKKEVKHKRSSTGHFNRPSETPNGTSRLLTVSFKETSQKVRRATTDSGVSKSAKNSVEAPRKPLPSLRRQKSDQQPSTAPLRPPSLSTASDEENEPFVVPRSKRAVSKRKGSFTKTSPKPMIDHVPPPLPPLIRKSSLHSAQPDLIQLEDSTNDQQWHMVSSNKGQRKGTGPRRETSEESQTTTTNHKPQKISPTDVEKATILTSSPPSHTPSSVSHKPIQSRHRHRPTQSPSPPLLPNVVKGKNSQDNNNRELAFRQLTEQLWAAGLPSSTTACSMSIRSRCSSAPPSERGGDDESIKVNGTNPDEENIDWDEPDLPDEDFGRYASQTEQSMDDLTGKKPTIPPLMSLSITPPQSLSPPPIMTNSTQQNFVMPTSITKENIEPLPFPQQHVPGPIQRPTKLSCPPLLQTLPYLRDPTRSPDTPEVLVQINHLVDHQNSITTASSNVTSDLPTPSIPWTPFAPPEWPTKYESTWPSSSATQNPFAQRQISKDESNPWSDMPINNTSWLKFTATPPVNRPENEANLPFWNPSETQPNSSTSWWPKTPSDENNNDQSRWEFAR